MKVVSLGSPVCRVPSTSQASSPLDANVGDAIEEFMHYAEELKHHVAKGKDCAALAWAWKVGAALVPQTPTLLISGKFLVMLKMHRICACQYYLVMLHLFHYVCAEPASGQSLPSQRGSAEPREDIWPRRGFLSRMFARQAECSPGKLFTLQLMPLAGILQYQV